MSNRPWDKAISPDILPVIRGRRHSPDGQERVIGHKMVGGGQTNVYPWSSLKDGDYFFVEIGRSKDAMRVYFRQTAARLDIELAVTEYVRRGKPHFRVTRVMSGISEVKRLAGVAQFDLERRREYLNERRKKERRGKRKINKPKIAKIEVSEPTEPVVGREVTTHHDVDYAKLREERLRQARLEAAGLEEEDADFMGVTEE